MERKMFCACKCCVKSGLNVEHFRNLAEEISLVVEKQINDYCVLYTDINNKYHECGLKYTKNKYRRYDNVPLNQCTVVSFCDEGPPRYNADTFEVCYIPNRWNDYIRINWISEDIEETNLKRRCKEVQSILCKYADINMFVVGSISIEKHANWIAFGVITGDYSKVEKEVASNINFSINNDNRLPFLFPYTYMKNMSYKEYGDTITFGELLLKDIDTYFDNEKWIECYEDMVERDLIIPLELPRKIVFGIEYY